MNKIEVGNAPSPNLRKVASKIGSLENATYKPGELDKSDINSSKGDLLTNLKFQHLISF